MQHFVGEPCSNNICVCTMKRLNCTAFPYTCSYWSYSQVYSYERFLSFDVSTPKCELWCSRQNTSVHINSMEYLVCLNRMVKFAGFLFGFGWKRRFRRKKMVVRGGFYKGNLISIITEELISNLVVKRRVYFEVRYVNGLLINTEDIGWMDLGPVVLKTISLNLD